MKYLLIFIALTGQLFAQNLEIDKYDEFENKYLKRTEFVEVGKSDVSRISFRFLSIKKESDLVYGFAAKPNMDLGCAGARNNDAIILFTDGSRITLVDIARVDCSDNASSAYMLTKSEYRKICTTKIKKIRVRMSKYYDDYKITKPNTIRNMARLVKQ